MWHRFNPNPQGNGVGDCTVRAVAAAQVHYCRQSVSARLDGIAKVFE